MSKETIEHLNTQTLIGFTEKRGNAWHYREDLQEENNHYAGAVPVDDVRRRLFPWDLIEAPVEYVLGGNRYTDDTRKVIARSDTGAAMGVFKAGYQIHQYQDWLIDNVATMLDADLAIGSAGLLKGGAVAWVQIEMEDTLSVQGMDFRPFLTAATSHDGSLATTYQVGAQVVVCDNTLSAALGERGSERVKVRHSKRSLGKYQDVRDALSIVHQVADDFQNQVNALTAREVSDADWKRFTEAYTGLDKEMDAGHALTIAEKRQAELAMLWNSDPRVSPWAGTAWGVVQAVNTHAHHFALVRGATRAARNTERAVEGKVDALDAGTLALLDRVMVKA